MRLPACLTIKDKRVWVIIIIAFLLSVLAGALLFGSFLVFSEEGVCIGLNGKYLPCSGLKLIVYFFFMTGITTVGAFLSPIAYIAHIIVFIALLLSINNLSKHYDLKKRSVFLTILVVATFISMLVRSLITSLTWMLY